MTNHKTPVRQLARSAELAITPPRHSRTRTPLRFGSAASSGELDWQILMGERRAALEALMARAGSLGQRFSSGLTYALLQLSDRAESQRPGDAIWRSHYRLARFFRDRVKGDDSARDRREQLLTDAIREIGGALGTTKALTACRFPCCFINSGINVCKLAIQDTRKPTPYNSTPRRKANSCQPI